MSRRRFLKSSAALGAALTVPGIARADAVKVFRWALPAAETGFDPAQISDLYSNYVVQNIFDAPLQYDYLARPAALRTKTAAAMPEVSADFRSFTVRIRPGIYFQDDPVFRGRRELTAADHVYQLKRIADPRWKSPAWSGLESLKVLGLAEARARALKTGRFDYDAPIEGILVPDRFTFQIVLAEPNPRFAENFADARAFGAVAREVVEANADQIMGKPVGTGPFRLAQWDRASLIVLTRNPGYRDEFYDAQPAADDARGQKILARLKGRKLPLVDRVELSVIEESQPRWLSFMNGQQDTANVPLEFISLAAPNGHIAPALARRGMALDRFVNPDVTMTYFSMDDPIVGGYTPAKVALRRAIALGYDGDEEIRLIRRGAAIPAQSQVPPLTSGYDASFVSEMGQFDRARAQALLDIYGYIDRNGDGWREQPDGSPLTLVMTTQSSQIDRAFSELWQRQMERLQLRIEFKINQWPENLKAARAGKLMMWQLGNSAASSDSDDFLRFGATSGIGGSNFARFSLPAYDRLYDRQRVLPDGSERDAIIRELKRLFVAWMPYKIHNHRIINDVSQPWLIGYLRHPFARDFFKWIDIDPALQPRA